MDKDTPMEGTGSPSHQVKEELSDVETSMTGDDAARDMIKRESPSPNLDDTKASDKKATDVVDDIQLKILDVHSSKTEDDDVREDQSEEVELSIVFTDGDDSDGDTATPVKSEESTVTAPTITHEASEKPSSEKPSSSTGQGSSYMGSGSVLMGLLTRKNDAPVVYPKLISNEEPESIIRSRCYTCPTSKDMRTRPELKQHLKNIQTSYLLDLSMKNSASPTNASTTSSSTRRETPSPRQPSPQPTGSSDDRDICRRSGRKRSATERFSAGFDETSSHTSHTATSNTLSTDDTFKKSNSIQDTRNRRKPKKTVQILPAAVRCEEKICIVCGKDVSMEKHFSVFKKRSAATSEHSIVTRLIAVLGQEVKQENTYSNCLCSQCVSRIEMVEKGREMERLMRVEFKKTQALIAAKVDNSDDSECEQQPKFSGTSTRPVGTITPQQSTSFNAMCNAGKRDQDPDILPAGKKRRAIDGILRSIMEGKSPDRPATSQTDQCNTLKHSSGSMSILQQTLLGAIEQRPINIVPETDDQFERIGPAKDGETQQEQKDENVSEEKPKIDDVDMDDEGVLDLSESPVIKIEPIEDDGGDSELRSTNKYITNYFEQLVSMPVDETIATASVNQSHSAMRSLLTNPTKDRKAKKGKKTPDTYTFVTETHSIESCYEMKMDSTFVSYECLLCGIGIQSKTGMEAHIQCHLLSTKHLKCFKCDYINPKLPTQWRIMRCHLIQEHGIEDRVFGTGRHVCTEKDCEYMAPTEDDLSKHLQYIHGLNDINKYGSVDHRLKSTGLFDYPCRICNTLLYSKEQLRIHMLCHGNNSRSYVCYLCQYCHHSMPGSWRFMKGHLVKKHAPDEIPMQDFYFRECEHYGCKEKFASDEARDIHTRCHMPDSDNMFFCCVCNFRHAIPAFWDTIKEHILFMHPYIFDGPFTCLCNKKFENLMLFNLHINEDGLGDGGDDLG